MGRFRCLVDPSLGKRSYCDTPGASEIRKSGPAGGAERRPLPLFNYVSNTHFDPPKCHEKGISDPPKSILELL